jgi:ClpP class serine protease
LSSETTFTPRFAFDNFIIPEGRVGIVQAYGFRMLSRIANNLQMMQSGVTYTDLGIKEMKEKSQTKVIAVVDLSGVIMKEDGWCSYGTKTKGEQLLAMKDEVIGAIFKIDSGGGYMDGAESMVADMREFGKPIVALGSYVGSAAYMIACEAKQILATSKFAEFGSIGVYIELDKRVRDFYQKYVQFAYSKKSQNKNSEFRTWIEEEDEGDAMKGWIESATQADDLFMAHVKQNRKLNKDKREETLSGGMFYTDDAIERGLVDAEGDNKRAIALIQKLSRI